MKKVFVVTRAASREAMLDALRAEGVMHLEPVEPSAAAPEELSSRLTRLRQARQVIAAITPAGGPPEVNAQAAADEILTIFRRTHDNRNRLSALHREADHLGVWGDLRCEQLDALTEAGVPVRFYSVPEKQLGEIVAECVAPLVNLPGKRVLAAVVQRDGEPTLPEEARLIEPPKRDLHTVRAEAKEVDRTLADDAGRLTHLANLSDALERRGEELASEVNYAKALAGAMKAEDLFAVQGWAPAEESETLAADLAAHDIIAAVDSRDPADEETPPTLIRYPRWAGPIKGLFDILGTSPGYREFDVSGFFMIALPIFAAMLIGDAGYGLIFLLLPLLIYRKAVAAAGAARVHLIMVVGAATMIWGLLTGNIFGISPAMLVQAGGVWSVLGSGLSKVQIIHGDLKAQTLIVMKLSFIIGTIHLSIAQLRQSLRLMPNLQFLAHLGWAAFLWGMLGVIWYLFFGSQQTPPAPLHPAATWLLVVGGAMAILFAHPGRNPARMVGFGLASFPLAALSTFSDTISYIRLMVVGLASVVIAQTFNSLGAQCAEAATWFAGAPIVLLGHALNVALCLIALLAHGVRLNMLEFSSNAGVEWAGYSYEPFATAMVKESG